MDINQRKRIEEHLTHLNDFRSAAVKLSMALFENGQANLARILLANAQLHDQSKFYGVEWDVLVLGNRQDLLKTAVEQHNRSNAHHPEYWGKIQDMDDVHVGEMCCDWKARSGKFGTSLEDWIHNEAMERYGFTKEDQVYEKIMRFIGMILDKPFQRLS